MEHYLDLYFEAGKLAFHEDINDNECPLKKNTPEYKEWMKGWWKEFNAWNSVERE